MGFPCLASGRSLPVDPLPAFAEDLIRLPCLNYRVGAIGLPRLTARKKGSVTSQITTRGGRVESQDDHQAGIDPNELEPGI